jgi:2-iminoacetate synthase
MSFYDEYLAIDQRALSEKIESASQDQVARVLAQKRWSVEDFPVLISPAAEPFLETMANLSSRMTLLRFGKTIRLYTPLYISNECVNNCQYCGFSLRNAIERRTLSQEEVVEETDFLYQQGFRHILLVSGESPAKVPVSYLKKLAQILREKFSGISIEIYPLDLEGYQTLADNGVSGIAIYQETFDREIYQQVHMGPKADFEARLKTPELACEAGFREVGIGVLLGLADYRLDLALLASQAHYLMKRWWRSQVAVSFPRLRDAEGCMKPSQEVTDRQLAQAIFALRMVLPDADLVLSTRESRKFRDGMVGLGITRMSAGSKTRPGGYVVDMHSLEQFEVADTRNVQEVVQMIESKGFEAVWKDFDQHFLDE